MRLRDLVTPEEFKRELFRDVTPEDEVEAGKVMEDMTPYADVILGMEGPHKGSVMMTLQIIDAILRKKVVQ